MDKINIVTNEDNTKEEHGSRVLLEAYDWIQNLVLAVFVFLVIFTFLSRVITVDGDSMVPTLHNSEKLIVSNLFYNPTYDDIVIVHAEKLSDRDNPGGNIVKRVIGVAGDRIKIDFEKGIVYRNGVALEDKYTNSPTNYNGDYMGNGGMTSNKEITVENGTVFVLGDNRNVSVDSRSNMVGLVKLENIAGRAILRFFPFNNFGLV